MIVKRVVAMYLYDEGLDTWRKILKCALIFLMSFVLAKHVFFISLYDVVWEHHRSKNYTFDCEGQDKLQLTIYSPLFPGTHAEMSSLFLAWLVSVIITGFLHAL